MGDVVTIVIPAYNEARRFRSSLPRLRATFEGDDAVEVIVVDDGSTDGTSQVAADLLAGWPAVHLVRLPWNGGKGAAVKAGVALAAGDITAFMDADLSADLDDFERLLGALDHADIALGSRAIAGSRAVYETMTRRMTSKVFNDVVCAVARVIASDTQCGFKAFRTPVAKLLFHLTEVEGFAFDVEVLALAQLLGYRVAEVPVGWVEADGSRVRPRDPLLMLRDVLKTRRRYDRALRLHQARGTSAPAAGAHVLRGAALAELAARARDPRDDRGDHVDDHADPGERPELDALDVLDAVDAVLHDVSAAAADGRAEDVIDLTRLEPGRRGETRPDHGGAPFARPLDHRLPTGRLAGH